MNLVEFPEQTTIIAKNQLPYYPLPAYCYADREGRIAFCWSLSWRERFKVLFTGRIWHHVLTFNHPLQPQLLEVTKPDFPKRGTKIDYEEPA